MVKHTDVYVLVRVDPLSQPRIIVVNDKLSETKNEVFIWKMDILIPLTTRQVSAISTIVSTPPVTLQCYNNGNLVNGICHCPSGFTGRFCQEKNGKKMIGIFF